MALIIILYVNLSIYRRGVSVDVISDKVVFVGSTIHSRDSLNSEVSS